MVEESCGPHPLTPFYFGGGLVLGNGKNRLSPPISVAGA